MMWTCLSKLKRMIRRACIVLFAVLLTGCISMPQSHVVTMAPNVTLQLTAPPKSLQMQSQSQLIEAQFNDETHSLLAQVEFTDSQIKLVAMTPSGIPLFDVLWSVTEEAVINQYVPVPGLDISYVIADIQWVSWPLAQLQSATTGILTELPTENVKINSAVITNEEQNWTRILTQDDQVILTVEKHDNRYILKHLLRDYQITITELSKVSL